MITVPELDHPGVSPDAATSESPTPDWGPTSLRTIEWYNPLISAEAGKAMSGIDFLRAIATRKLPPPPIAALLRFAPVEIEVGRVVFECAPDESEYNPIGLVHGGLVCTLADTVGGCAVQSTLEAGFTFTSIDLNVSYIRPVTAASGILRATGTVTKPGRRVAFASAEILDGLGKLVATATTSCLIIDLRDRPPHS